MDMKHLLSIVDGASTAGTQKVDTVVKTKTKSIFESYVANVVQEQIEDREYNTSKASKLAERVTSKMFKNAKPIKKKYMEEADPVDTVTLDVPLLIRLLEYAKEDAETDMDLHNVSEKLIELSKTNDVLSMEQYDAIVGSQLALPEPEEY